MYHRLPPITRFLLCLIIPALPFNALRAADASGYTYESEILKLTIKPRTAQQMSAFYEGRGFPADSVALTRTACFFTVGIKNKTRDVLWLDTANWQFSSASGPLQAISRDEWRQHWQKIGLEQSFQSTFRWTLLPEQLDFQPDEREGGNITLPRTDKAFTLHASFISGKDKQGARTMVEIKDLRCAVEQQ